MASWLREVQQICYTMKLGTTYSLHHEWMSNLFIIPCRVLYHGGGIADLLYHAGGITRMLYHGGGIPCRVL